MRRQGTPVSREALYEEVWTDAVTVVAPRLGLSDVGLVKCICRCASRSTVRFSVTSICLRTIGTDRQRNGPIPFRLRPLSIRSHRAHAPHWCLPKSGLATSARSSSAPDAWGTRSIAGPAPPQSGP